MNLKIQVPSEYKANKEKNHFTAKRSDGVSFSVQFTPMGPDACLSRFKKDKGEAQKAFQNGGLVRVQEKKVGSYEKSTPVVYTLSKKGTAHTVKWQGCDYPRKRYVTIAAQFPGNTYSLHQPEADRMFASIRWQHDAR
jgi:hypothetical protein